MSETIQTTSPAVPLPIDKIAAALAAAQGELTNPPKTKTANLGKYKYRYADLAEIIEHVRPVLAKHSLAVVQLTVADSRNVLVTRLIHASGQYLESTYPLPTQAAAQDMGSAITYARRYSLCAILGIAADEDDDVEQATKGENNREAIVRDELIEQMGRASLGNAAILGYTRTHDLGDGKTVDDLPVESVKRLLDDWPAVVEACQKAREAKKPPAASTAAKQASLPQQQPDPPTAPPLQPTQPPSGASDGNDLAGIDQALAALMREHGVTAAMLKDYYVGQGHFPATVAPNKLPATYVKAITAPGNWTKAIAKMKETK